MAIASGSVELILQVPGEPDKNLGQAGDTAMAKIRSRVFSLDDEQLKMFIQRIQTEVLFIEHAPNIELNIYRHANYHDLEGVLDRTFMLSSAIITPVPKIKNIQYLSIEIVDRAVTTNWAFAGFTFWGEAAGKRF